MYEFSYQARTQVEAMPSFYLTWKMTRYALAQEGSKREDIIVENILLGYYGSSSLHLTAFHFISAAFLSKETTGRVLTEAAMQLDNVWQTINGLKENR